MRPSLRELPPRRFRLSGEEPIEVRVRESPRARTARLSVGPRRPLEIVVPRGISGAAIDRILEGKRHWIEKHVPEARERAVAKHRLGLERPGVVWLGGRPVPLERVEGGRSIAELRNGRVVVRGPAIAATAALARWYRREARRRIAAAVGREGARLGLRYGAIGVRDQRTRWGSCSSRGTLSFSWRLVVAPVSVLEYVVVHELCHLRQPNHSRAFWELVATASPDAQEQRRWLREHGHELHLYDAALALPTATVGERCHSGNP